MGYGRWDNKSRAAYTVTSDRAKAATHYTEVFKSSEINKALDPKNIVVRESRDSEENPNSTPIILALDVTGSMGDIAHQIAKDGLGKLIEGILDRKPVTDPHILFSAIGDVYCDSAPLQASQFEPDIRIVQQLQDLYIEGGGGGNNTESYDLPWYFAAMKTSIDSYEKRQKKGYLFTFGDEMPPDGLSVRDLKDVFGDGGQQDYTPKDLLKLAEEQWHVFHLVVEEGYYTRHYGKDRVLSAWKKLMGNRAIPLRNYKHLAEVVLAAMHISEGTDVEEVVSSYQDKEVKETVRHAFGA